MSEDFDSLNKQIASFIIVSAAFSAPVYADGIMPTPSPSFAPVVNEDIILRYAGPGMGGSSGFIQIDPIDKYAGPVMPIVEPQPMPIIIARYAGPPTPEPVRVQPIDTEGSASNANNSLVAPINNINGSNGLNNADDFKANKLGPGHFVFE